MSANPEDTRGVYERQARRFDADRSRQLFERGWLERFSRELPPSGSVLDVGCGGGEPIARWLIDQGFRVTGVDFSEPMLEIARDRWPAGDWRLADMRTLDLGEHFDGLIAWNSFFHLTADEQTSCIPRLAEHVAPGGTLMLTVGPGAGQRDGTVGSEPIYHASLSPDDYVAQFEECGLHRTAFVPEDPTCEMHSVLMARKQDDVPRQDAQQ